MTDVLRIAHLRNAPQEANWWGVPMLKDYITSINDKNYKHPNS